MRATRVSTACYGCLFFALAAVGHLAAQPGGNNGARSWQKEDLLEAWKKVEELKMQTRMLEMEKFAATGRLAGTIAHEINNPMEAIKNSIHLLGRHVDHDGSELYELLNRETSRVARIVRQMLGLYRANDRPMAFDLNMVVEDTLTLFARQLERADIKVEKELGEIPPVVGSADQMRQVVSNLVVNARDSMSTGGRLRIRTRLTRSAETAQGLVRIVVAEPLTAYPLCPPFGNLSLLSLAKGHSWRPSTLNEIK